VSLVTGCKMQVNSSRRRQSLPAVASSGESEETTDSGRGSCDDVTGRCGAATSQRNTSQTTNIPLPQRSPYNGITFSFYR